MGLTFAERADSDRIADALAPAFDLAHALYEKSGRKPDDTEAEISYGVAFIITQMVMLGENWTRAGEVGSIRSDVFLARAEGAAGGIGRFISQAPEADRSHIAAAAATEMVGEAMPHLGRRP